MAGGRPGRGSALRRGRGVAAGWFAVLGVAAASDASWAIYALAPFALSVLLLAGRAGYLRSLRHDVSSWAAALSSASFVFAAYTVTVHWDPAINPNVNAPGGRWDFTPGDGVHFDWFIMVVAGAFPAVVLSGLSVAAGTIHLLGRRSGLPASRARGTPLPKSPRGWTSLVSVLLVGCSPPEVEPRPGPARTFVCPADVEIVIDDHPRLHRYPSMVFGRTRISTRRAVPAGCTLLMAGSPGAELPESWTSDRWEPTETPGAHTAGLGRHTYLVAPGPGLESGVDFKVLVGAGPARPWRAWLLEDATVEPPPGAQSGVQPFSQPLRTLTFARLVEATVTPAFERPKRTARTRIPAIDAGDPPPPYQPTGPGLPPCPSDVEVIIDDDPRLRREHGILEGHARVSTRSDLPEGCTLLLPQSPGVERPEQWWSTRWRRGPGPRSHHVRLGDHDYWLVPGSALLEGVDLRVIAFAGGPPASPWRAWLLRPGDIHPAPTAAARPDTRALRTLEFGSVVEASVSPRFAPPEFSAVQAP